MALVGCENRPINDPSARLELSMDTLSFDTVFTHEGSATRVVMLRNPHKRAVTIRSVAIGKGEAFKVNVDGEQNLSKLKNITIAGGDSLFIFVRATIRPEDRNQPLLLEDRVLFEVGDHVEQLVVQAFGWDVNLIDSLVVESDLHFTAGKPYLIKNYVAVAPGATLFFDAGAHVYMHDGAQLSCQGGLIANGQEDQRILIQSDRLDNLFDGIPYVYTAGKWDGIYLLNPDTANLQYTDIKSGNVGFYLEGNNQQNVTIEHCRIHNHSLYGVVLQDVNALIGNTEISNCAQYGAYVSGGKYEFVHTTLASFFNATAYGIQTVPRVDSISPLYINNLSKKRPTEVTFLNCVLAGAQKNCLMLATPLPAYYSGVFANNYLQTDSLSSNFAHDNVYGQRRDTVFVNAFYGNKDQYYDFRLDSVSKAIGIGDASVASRYPKDLDGKDRLADGKPDAGCYERGF